jgi:signal transduction histidine kinase
LIVSMVATLSRSLNEICAPETQAGRLPNVATSKFARFGLACCVILLTFLTSELAGMLEMHLPRPVWALWPGCAVVVTVLLLVRRNLWSVVIPAGLFGFVLYDLRAGLAIDSILVLLLIDTAEILTAALGLRLVFDSKPRLDTFRGLLKYLLIALFSAPVVAATFGAILIRGEYWVSWRIIFLSEALAFLTVPTAISSVVRVLQTDRIKDRNKLMEAGILLTGVFLLGYVMSVTSGRSLTPALSYALVPFLIWGALRFGHLGVSTSILIIAFLSIWGALHGRGPFMESTRTGTSADSVISLQLFLLCAAIPFMVLAALADEHKQTEIELGKLGGRLIKAQEEERNRIARELHDDLSQSMARLLMRLNRCQQGLAEGSPRYHEELDAVTEMASEVSASLRDLSHFLHPATLATLGLVSAIAGFCREFSERHHLVVKFVHGDIPDDTPEDVNLCLFRIVQESLRNVLKHSGAQEAHVDLSQRDKEIVLLVEDAGRGFDVKSNRARTALGLISMRERVRLVGGEISVESAPWSGTRIGVQIPFGSPATATQAGDADSPLER